ncbi:MAG: TRAP transporter substrate-binding protein DctP [Planctomycetaceae bacterium]|nr:TRAP transporter substrate-binding protein DctP [Planctomycetaceae bacterium]
MPKLTSICLLLCLSSIGLLGCDPDDSNQRLTALKLAHVYEIHSPTHRYGTARLEEQLVSEGTPLSITVYPAAQLGNEAELLEQLVAGELELAIAGPSFLGMWHPPLGVFDAAYVFRDLDHMLQVAKGPIMAPHWEQLRQKYGVRVLDTWAYGSRHITANRPIRSPVDLADFRLRLPGAKVWQESGRALGARPLPVPFGEVYLALQQGIADGQENPVAVIKTMGFHEVQQYLCLTGHIQSSIQILVNERTWARLSPEEQKSLQAAVVRLGDEVHRDSLAEEAELLAQWRADGSMNIVDDVDLALFRERCREHFSSGYAFSELYREISAMPATSDTTAMQQANTAINTDQAE